MFLLHHLLIFIGKLKDMTKDNTSPLSISSSQLVTEADKPTEQTESNKEGIGAYKTMIKVFAIVAGLWGAMSTATHYIGYSFLQGRIEGLGLGVHEIKLSTHETIRQASLAMFEIRQDVLNSLIETLKMGWVGYTLTGLLGAFSIKILFNKNKKKSKFKLNFYFLPNWLLQLAMLPLIAIAFVIYFLLLIFILVDTTWASLEVAHTVGVEKGLIDVASPISINLEDTKATEGLVPSIAHYLDADKKEYTGKIIFRNNEITVITTKDASYLFDSKRQLVTKSIKLDEGKVTNKVKVI
jgi:hypothetical protein